MSPDIEDLCVSANEQLTNIIFEFQKLIQHEKEDLTSETNNPFRAIEVQLSNAMDVLKNLEQDVKNSEFFEGNRNNVEVLNNTLEILASVIINCFNVSPSHIQKVLKKDCDIVLSEIKKLVEFIQKKK